MKTFALSLLVLIGAVNTGWAKTINVTDLPARSIMEALYASGFDVSNIDEEWSGKTLSVETKALTCHYTAVNAPDEWMSNVDCHKGLEEHTETLKESLALAKAIAPFADSEAGVGNRWLTVEGMKCSLTYDTKAYSCLINLAD